MGNWIYWWILMRAINKIVEMIQRRGPWECQHCIRHWTFVGSTFSPPPATSLSMLLRLICFHGSSVLFDFFFQSSTPTFLLSNICFVFSPALLFSSISLYRACSPPFTLSLTFRGTWWKSNWPAELVSLYFLPAYLHRAIMPVCVCCQVCVLTNFCCVTVFPTFVPLHLPSTLGCLVKPVLAAEAPTDVSTSE